MSSEDDENTNRRPALNSEEELGRLFNAIIGNILPSDEEIEENAERLDQSSPEPGLPSTQEGGEETSQAASEIVPLPPKSSPVVSETEQASEDKKLKEDAYFDSEVEDAVQGPNDNTSATAESNRIPIAKEPSQVAEDKKEVDVGDYDFDDFSEDVKEIKIDTLNQAGKHILYSKYVDQGATVVKQTKKKFMFDGSQSEGSSSLGEFEALQFQHSDDFTYGHYEDRLYILPKLTEHETQRLGGNRLLEEASGIGHKINFSDHLSLCMSYLTVISKSFLKDTFKQLSLDMKLIGKVYSARMLGRYHEYAKMFKFSAGREGGMVASMRFTSHCSDIIKAYIHLAQLLDDPKEFSNLILELAKRHAKLGLKLRDHQVHFKPFAEILGSWNEEPMKIYCALLFFLSMVSRSMIMAELTLNSKEEDEKLPLRSIRLTRPSPEVSRKQPTWD